MRHLLVLLAMILAGPALAADLPRGPIVILPQPASPSVCLTGRPIEIYLAPASTVNGILPAGMEVEVIDVPFSARADLWIRIKPPRHNQYYGWVYTRDLICH
ncbi:SH3 domain-containing protein [Acuticoccus mangrovi]|uniref:SH3b domain-containing protein n=1 Tax=Acuticoccus mangrovi TaxID=2796142 RepID=A0A934MP64_9HYPH|nr:SH3 domain-containing protein [Acuticoccus mangrovi]MBJ3778814.1 hypothetical protein [Acuticoccus mangrovi]